MNTFDTEQTQCVICGTTEGQVEASGVDYIYEGSSQICVAWRCTNCGHIYLNPRPTVNSIPILYPENYASFSGKFTEESKVISRLKEYIMMRRIRKFLKDLPAGARFLDIGCGDGQLLEAVKRQFPSIEVQGLDWRFEPEARRRLEAQGIILHESRLETADLPTSHFDLVTMNQLIEHLWQPRECLEMVRRILSPLGWLVLATPDVEGYDRQFFISGLWGGYYFPRHLNLFSRRLLLRLLTDCGLETIESCNLVAPVVWCYSLKAFTKIRFPSARWLHRICDVHNVPLMAIFTLLDMVAILFRVSTSNQTLVARPIQTQP